ncbi:MAG: ankyrin repeat domain-containing protein [Treponema sp.]|jgi:hypothetical protein|nr:ankyrin repeat domain-containing protein [Treponema sp.]
MKIFCFVIFLLISRILFTQEPEPDVLSTESQEETDSVRLEVWRLLLTACADGDAEQVKIAVDAGADVNAEENGVSPLMFAAYASNAAAVESLVKAGADVNFSNTDGVSALFIAAYMGHTQVVKVLASSGIRSQDRNLALHIAKEQGMQDTVEVLYPDYKSLDYRRLRRNEYKSGDAFGVIFNVSRIYVDKDNMYRASCLLKPNRDAPPNVNYEFFLESKSRFLFIEGDTIDAHVSFDSLQNIVVSEIPYRSVEQALFQLDKIIDIW